MQLAMYWNTSALKHIYLSIHNPGMLDSSPRSGHGSVFIVLSPKLADDVTDASEKRVIPVPLLVVSKALHKKLPGKPWNERNCRDGSNNQLEVSNKKNQVVVV